MKVFLFKFLFLGLFFAGLPASFALPLSAAENCNSFLESSLYQPVQIKKNLAIALKDPLMEEARELKAFNDFKILSDMAPRMLTKQRRTEIHQKAIRIDALKGRKKAIEFLVRALYKYQPELLSLSHSSLKSRYTLKSAEHKGTFDHIERTWKVLIRRTPKKTDSSLIPLPYPFVIPGSRFQEGYYWDTYFTFEALLSTDREDLVRGQIENFLFLLKNYGLIPNGSRQYYLSRSQPPMLSQMIRLYVENKMKTGKLTHEDLKWLREDVFPLVKNDYENFWMNPETRYDKMTGLNHHFDSQNTPRPERHSTDVEEILGQTYRDVRAEAESGKDFTAAFDGQATQYAGVMLNSILYQVEKDLNWMAKLVGRSKEAKTYLKASMKRKERMYKYLWDEKTMIFKDYHLLEKRQSPVITADGFVPLYVGLIEDKDATHSSTQLLSHLEKNGGLMSSNVYSGKQWDAPYGWAPHHYFAIQGLKNYGFHDDAKRLAQKWVNTVDNVYKKSGKIIEKYDMIRGDAPHEDGEKYTTQEGFAWTNGVYVWALEILGIKSTQK